MTAPSFLFPTYVEPFVEPRWRERDVTSPLPDVPVPPGLHQRCATHVKYTLSCRQFDRLLARSGGRCEVCMVEAARERFGVLSIDHAHNLGKWAVRGLLCNRCNTTLDAQADLAIYRDYLRRSFYLTLLAEARVMDLSPAEPPKGAVVLDHGGYPWRREVDFLPGLRWYPRHRRAVQSPETWEWLIAKSGPHRLVTYSTPETTAAKPAPDERWAHIAADVA